MNDEKKVRQNTDYGYDIQKVYLEMMLSDAATFSRCQNIFDSGLFDRKLQAGAEFINKYVDEHSVVPTEDIVNAATGSTFKVPNDLREEHYDWLLNDFETFIRHKGLERAILESADLLEKGDYGPVEEKIKAAVQVGLQRDLGTDYFLDPRKRLMKIKDKNGQVSTGWKSVDDRLFGGFNRGELNIFAGGSGAGKSLFLANLGLNFALTGMNVVYLTLELSEELVSMRMDSMLTEINSKEIFRNLDTVEIKIKQAQRNSGELHVRQLPQGSTCNDIKAYLKNYEIETKKRCDVLVVDYLDLLYPNSKDVDTNNINTKDRAVTEELRGLAVERNMVCVTASQLNRSAVEEQEHNHSMIAGGLSKIQTADNVISIFASAAMKERGQYQVQFLKTRSSSGVGSKVYLGFDQNTLKIFDLDEEQQNQLQNGTGGSEVFDQLRRKNAASQTDTLATARAITPDLTKNLQTLSSLTNLIRR